MSGVPQGSVLSPLLFCVYINDLLRKNFSSNVMAYADDLKVFNWDAQALQSDLNTLETGILENDMIINYDKREK